MSNLVALLLTRLEEANREIGRLHNENAQLENLQFKHRQLQNDHTALVGSYAMLETKLQQAETNLAALAGHTNEVVAKRAKELAIMYPERKIEAIKALRQMFPHLGLKGCKDAIDYAIDSAK